MLSASFLIQGMSTISHSLSVSLALCSLLFFLLIMQLYLSLVVFLSPSNGFLSASVLPLCCNIQCKPRANSSMLSAGSYKLHLLLEE